MEYAENNSPMANRRWYGKPTIARQVRQALQYVSGCTSFSTVEQVEARDYFTHLGDSVVCLGALTKWVTIFEGRGLTASSAGVVVAWAYQQLLADTQPQSLWKGAGDDWDMGPPVPPSVWYQKFERTEQHGH